MGLEKLFSLAKASLNLGTPLRMDQSHSFKLLVSPNLKISFQIDGESFKHADGPATITIENDFQINMLRYE